MSKSEKQEDLLSSLSDLIKSGNVLSEDGGIPSQEQEDDTAKKQSIVLDKNDYKIIDSLVDEHSGYFAQVFEYLKLVLKDGVEKGKFSEQEAWRDLEFVLNISYAVVNSDDYSALVYLHNHMKLSYDVAIEAKCATWFYRYGCTVLYLGNIDQAQKIFEEGIKLDPEYPWCYLELGRILAHKRKYKKAKELANKGLELKPDDHEFLTLLDDIAAKRTIEQMHFHYTNSSADKELNNGMADMTDDSVLAKRRLLECMRVDEEGLEKVVQALGVPLEALESKEDGHYVLVNVIINGKPLTINFEMNLAAISHMSPSYIQRLMTRLRKEDYIKSDKLDGIMVNKGVFKGVQIQLNGNCLLWYNYAQDSLYSRMQRIALDEDEQEDYKEESFAIQLNQDFSLNSRINPSLPKGGDEISEQYISYVFLADPKYKLQNLKQHILKYFKFREIKIEIDEENSSLICYFNGVAFSITLKHEHPNRESFIEPMCQGIDLDSFIDSARTELRIIVAGYKKEPVERVAVFAEMNSILSSIKSSVGISMLGVIRTPDEYNPFFKMAIASGLKFSPMGVMKPLIISDHPDLDEIAKEEIISEQVQDKLNYLLIFSVGMMMYGFHEVFIMPDERIGMVQALDCLNNYVYAVITHNYEPKDGENIEILGYKFEVSFADHPLMRTDTYVIRLRLIEMN